MYGHAAKVWKESGEDALEREYALYYFRQYLIFASVGVVSVTMASTSFGLAYGIPGWIYAVIGPLSYAHGVRFGPKRRVAKPV